jgi:hypothetical protein
MANLGQFARRMRILADRVEANASRIAVETALAIDQTVVLATHVDTGRARSNWIVSVRGPNHTVRPPYAQGEGLGKGEGANAAAAIAQGQRAIRLRPKNGGDIYIQNNLPYIGDLNAGSSAQAPANFVAKAIVVGTRAVRRRKVL